MNTGSLVKLNKSNFHNRMWLSFENMVGIVISARERCDCVVVEVFWSDQRFKITEWKSERLLLLQEGDE